MTKKNDTNLVDSYLESLTGMESADPKPFFYSRLITRLENEKRQTTWAFPLKPAWMIATLMAMLLLNTFILSRQLSPTKTNDTASIESFARAYDQEISTY
jgi:hypothetical protein